MKFSCSLSDLQQSLQIVSRAISSQQALPILSNILVKAEGKKCTLSATDLELSIISTIDADIENEGIITIPAKAIVNFAQYNSDSTVVLETVNGNQLKCTSAKAKTMISGEQASDYPTITPVVKEHSFVLPVQPIMEALSKVTFAAAKTTLRPVLSGVYMVIAKGKLTLVATDSYRLSEFKVPIEDKTIEVSAIIPAKVLEELKTVLATVMKLDTPAADSETPHKLPTIEVVLSSQQIEIHVGAIVLLSRLIDGKFPNYEQIIPKESTTSVGIGVQEFTTTLKRMHFFAKEMNNNVTFSITKEGLHMTTTQTQAGQDETTLSSEVTGQDTKIALSSSYLLDFLSHTRGDTITLRLTDSMHPAVFTLPDNDEYLHLIMPLRLQE